MKLFMKKKVTKNQQILVNRLHLNQATWIDNIDSMYCSLIYWSVSICRNTFAFDFYVW